MKALLYTSKITAAESKASVPKSLSRILNQSRKHNSLHVISGLLTFRKGHYFQILEGPDLSIDQLYESIERDERHENVLLICQFEIDTAGFGEPGMNLANDGKYAEQLKGFIQEHHHRLQEISAEKCRLLKQYFNINIVQGDAQQDESLSSETHDESLEIQRIGLANSLFKITKWPLKDIIQNSQANHKACLELSKRECGYHELLNSCDFVNGDELRGLLTRLRVEGILEIRIIDDENLDQSKLAETKVTQGGLYNRMVRFLKP